VLVCPCCACRPPFPLRSSRCAVGPKLARTQTFLPPIEPSGRARSLSIPCRALTIRASSSSFRGVRLGRIRSRGEQLREVPSPDLLRSVLCASWRTPSGRRGTRCRGHARFAEPRLPPTCVPDGRALLHCGYACPASECARTIDSRWSQGRRVRSRRSSMPECVDIARLGAAGEIPSLCY